jgi:hypothetical protein
VKKVQFAQNLYVEVWVSIELPDNYTDEDIADYIQSFPLDVQVVQDDVYNESNCDHSGTEFHVHSINYNGAAELQGQEEPDVF